LKKQSKLSTELTRAKLNLMMMRKNKKSTLLHSTTARRRRKGKKKGYEGNDKKSVSIAEERDICQTSAGCWTGTRPSGLNGPIQKVLSEERKRSFKSSSQSFERGT
jgi:hypothetical protein